jgi:6-methylsalicylate decarboxylase
MLSITAPGFGIGKLGVADVRKIIRQCNEAAMGYTMDYPGRFGSLAAIPLPDTEGSLLELAYALDTLKADGVTVFSNYQSRWLGDASYYPVYEELNRRKAVVFVHPTAGDCCAHLVPDVNDNIIEFAADTTRTIASLLYTGATIRYPDIRWVFSHGGGAVPFLVERFLLGSGEVEIVPGIITRGQYGPPPGNLPEGALPEIRKLHFDTAHTGNPIALSALKQLVPVSQIIFGSDYWYRTAEETAANIYASQVLTDQELSIVLRENAQRLFPRLASAA